MEDTTSDVRAVQQRMWMALSEEERFRRCGDLFALQKAFAEKRAPFGVSQEERKRFVFRELYGFDLPERDK